MKGIAAVIFILGMLLAAGPGVAATPPGYENADGDVAKALPVDIVFLGRDVRPLVVYNRSEVPAYIGGPYAGMSYGQNIGIGLLGTLIAGALINGRTASKAKSHARQSWEQMQADACNLNVEGVQSPVIRSALGRVPWYAQQVVTVHALDAGDPARAEEKTKPRQRIALRVNLTPDLRSLISSAIIEGYPMRGSSGNATRKPSWRNYLVVVSLGMDLPRKREEDVDALQAVLDKVVETSGDKEQASWGITAEDVKSPEWTAATANLMQAHLWTADQCALLNRVAIENATILGDMMVALYGGDLPRFQKK